MTVRGGRVRIEPGIVYWLGNETPFMDVRVTISANFNEDMDEAVEIVKKRLREAQTKINLEICGIVEDEE